MSTNNQNTTTSSSDTSSNTNNQNTTTSSSDTSLTPYNYNCGMNNKAIIPTYKESIVPYTSNTQIRLAPQKSPLFEAIHTRQDLYNKIKEMFENSILKQDKNYESSIHNINVYISDIEGKLNNKTIDAEISMWRKMHDLILTLSHLIYTLYKNELKKDAETIFNNVCYELFNENDPDHTLIAILLDKIYSYWLRNEYTTKNFNSAISAGVSTDITILEYDKTSNAILRDVNYTPLK